MQDFAMPGEPPRRRSGGSHEALGDERPRGMAIPAAGLLHGGTEPGLHAVWLSFQNISRTLSKHPTMLPLLVSGIAIADYMMWRVDPTSNL